jgi:hypothetical protein
VANDGMGETLVPTVANRAVGLSTVAKALRTKLETVLSDAPWKTIEAQPGHISHAPIRDVRAIVVHETSMPASRAQGTTMLTGQLGAGGHGETTQLFVAGDGTVLLGMELPRQTGHATFVNAWSLGSETGHPWGNWPGANALLGPWTTAANGALLHMPQNGWRPLRGQDRLDRPEDDDLPGEKLYLWHAGNEPIVGRWTTSRYQGPWRQKQRVPEAPFSEWQYRSWALLARYLAERFLVPRNFPLLPHKQRSSGFGTEGGLHSMLRDTASFRSIVNADEILSRKVTDITSLPALPANPPLPAQPPRPGLTQAQFDDPAQLGQRYVNNQNIHNVTWTDNAGEEHTFVRNEIWRNVFFQYRGIHGHGFSGDAAHGRDHDCPGPMFDWHRFAREVWDWWWRPFDLLFVDLDVRPYVPITRHGDTPLTEHYFHTSGPDYLASAVPGIHGAKSSPRTYRTAKDTRVYALANGELVAARFPVTSPVLTSGVSLAFSVVRHHVYHKLDELQLIPNVMREEAGLEPLPAVLPDRLSYDLPPSTVYTLYMHLSRTGISFDEIADGNPDWLNRLLVRKKECKLGVDYHSLQGDIFDTDPRWLTPPPGTPQRPTVLQAWRADEAYLSSFLDGLRAGRLVLAPQDAFATPIRVVLGDYMGRVGLIRRTPSEEHYGVRVEVFSQRVISREFTFTASDPPTAGWVPVGGGNPAVRYQIEWARQPEGEERATLLAAGVAEEQLGLVDWFPEFALSTTLNRRWDDPAWLHWRGGVVHYDPDRFMEWINRKTWRSEWPKYRLTDPVEAPDPRPRTL